MMMLFKKKKSKQKIPKAVRKAVWEKVFGTTVSTGLCQCCFSTKITIWDFESCHIKAEACGGETTITNLIPGCGLCNRSAGKRDFHEFQKTYGFTVERGCRSCGRKQRYTFKDDAYPNFSSSTP